MRNLLSIDLEDWFCVSNFDDMLGREVWDACELRVVDSTRRLLELFDRRGVKATFFVLGWIAERAPELIREVATAGHEIACHGYHHHRLGYLDPARLDADLGKAMPLLRELAGAPIHGYRAPSFSLTRQTMWAVPVLERHGLRWDSSVFPFGGHPEYGIADAPLDPYRIGDHLLELPMSVVELGGRRVPCTGGGYFRLYPYELSAALIRRCHRAGRPAIFYAHPWEFDPEQPRMPLPAIKRFRHYNNLGKTLGRLERLLVEFEWGPMGPWATDVIEARSRAEQAA
ncbi:XrtA system polysaccharide deacetylase [Enhygromyxa salina]|uniref:Peptidoglycan deacetylase n=1 Tax=Enhygromyxa salina TaxID=215803 RepID=A0A2S9XLF1_9BACT|nr:XrtA system polysaccharide deacetylase [Enhygromyxa salina]PRP93683.1 Peptidoglycan deacetylase [Enhygromyxa salina]